MLKTEITYSPNEIESLCVQQIYNTEKIAKICIAKFSNVADVDTKKDLKITITNYENNMILLLKSKFISADLTDHVKNEMENWFILKSLINVESEDLQIDKIMININALHKECDESHKFNK